MPTEEQISHLKINILTQAQYDSIEEKDPNQIYMISDAPETPTKTSELINDGDGASPFATATQLAVEEGYSGTQTQWIASLRASDPKILPLSAYPTEESALEYMNAQSDHSVNYAWNNKIYCYGNRSIRTGTTGVLLKGYRMSGSSGYVAAPGLSLCIFKKSLYTAPVMITYLPYQVSSNPYVYGGETLDNLRTTLWADDTLMTRTAVTITADKLTTKYFCESISTYSYPSSLTLDINGADVTMNIVSSPDDITEDMFGEESTDVSGYIDSGVIYTAIIGETSPHKYIGTRNTYVKPAPTGYCETKTTYTPGQHYLTYKTLAEMQALFSGLASAHPDYVTETNIGKDQSDTYNMYSYVLDAPSLGRSGTALQTEKPTFIISSGLHGVEPDAVHEVYHFMDDLCNHFMESDHLGYLHSSVRFVIIPICNPWGYANQNYHNSRDVDLNKNFGPGYRNNGTANTGSAAYSEAETQHMKAVFDANPTAIFHLECHGKYGVDTQFADTIWFSLMSTLSSELIELAAETICYDVGRRLLDLGYQTNNSVGGYFTYYGLNGRPKDYTASTYGILSGTMEGTGCIYGETGYSANTQKINCEALENFALEVAREINSEVKILASDSTDPLVTVPRYDGEVE